MEIRQALVKDFKEQATQTKEIITDYDSDLIEDKSRDFLKLNEEGHHQIAIDYIETLETKYSKEDRDQVHEKVQQLREYFLALVYEEDFSMDLEERARASIEKIYAEMANEDKDGFVLLLHLEICYKKYNSFKGEVDPNQLFQELLLLASRVMKNPQLLKELYGFKGKA